MPDDATPTALDPNGDRGALGALAHRMNNALAYVVTNLNLLAEELESVATSEERARLARLIEGAGEGADKLSDLVRELKVLSWGDREQASPAVDLDEDTWDTGRTARVLVIDDEPQILSAVCRALRRYHVTPALSGLEAQRILADEGADYDLILCDVMMRDVNGMDLYRWVRERRPELLGALVFMTAGAFTRDIRQFLASVPNTVLHKPFDTKTLRWAVAQKIRGEQR